MRTGRLAFVAFVALLAALPAFAPQFWVTLANYIASTASSRSGSCCSPAWPARRRSGRRRSSGSARTPPPT